MEEINNNSGCSDYTDFTSLSTTLVSNNTYQISIETAVAGNTSSFYPGDEVAVWIDYNNNLIYEDDQERVALMKEKMDLAAQMTETNLFPSDFVYDHAHAIL